VAILFWDASALAKRYIVEIGSDVVDQVFAAAAAHQMMGTVLGYAETFSTVLRRRNRGEISDATFVGAKTLLRDEVVNDPRFALLTVDDAAVFDGISLMERHNINATDSAILALLMRYTRTLPVGAPACLMIAADRGLLRAAQAEGIHTLNPESFSAANVPPYLASL
jgi:predicted nucleic acid-binding protein